MNKFKALKIAAAVLLVGVAIFVLYRPVVVAPGSEAAAEPQSSVSKGVAEAVNMPGKTLMAAYPPPDYDRPAMGDTPPITPQTGGVTEVKVGTTSFLVLGKDIYGVSGGEDGWNKIAVFPVPDGSLFKKYRPKTEMWSYETEIGQSTGSARGIWAGNSFYSGEGFNGIGGVVFYDVSARKFGVFRHPALVDCSAGALSVSDELLVVRTSRQREGSSSVCNGVVVIDFKTLKAVSYIPVESSVITDHDPAPGAKLLGDKYSVPLEKVLSGEAGFEKKDAPNWADAEREKILAEGLVPYMLRTAREEAEAGAAAEAARPKDVRSDHMWIDNSRAASEALRAAPEEDEDAGTGDINEKEVADVFSGLAKKEFMKVYGWLTEIMTLRPQAVELSGKEGAKKYYCICALAQDPAHTDYDSRLSFDENAKHSRVGCFILSGTRPAKILKLADVPTRRWRDYSGRCVAGEVENEVVVTFNGDTYGDQAVTRRYAVDPASWTSELITESSAN
jgi:hypothetical protein